ncbi:MAG: hypothetical protein K1X83_08235 [Oligoflexia bacterium]|nr:hypothetical protein [Oligoflexia bacterium]
MSASYLRKLFEMNDMQLNKLFGAVMALAILAFASGCTDLNSPYYPSSQGGYNDPYYDRGSRYDDYYYNRERDRARDERHELERERRRAEETRERLEAERERAREARRPPPPRQEHCPSGFSPSEQKCSDKERKHGCRDMRLPGGLGCVSR